MPVVAMTQKSDSSWRASFSDWIASLPQIFVVVSGMGLVVVIGWLDFITGTDISFAVFYVIPVALIGWYGNWVWAIAMSCISAASWFGANLLVQPSVVPSLGIFAWNAATRLGFFLIIGQTLYALRRALEQERIFARTDTLTGALNYRAFHEMAEMERQRALRYQHPLTLLYIDADDFKTVNDQWGHQTGDEVLRRIAETLKSHLRATDVTARLGGDEFAVMLPETSPEAAQTTAHKIRDRLLEEMQRAGQPITFSIGVLTFVKLPNTVDIMVAEADALMYAVKRSGKNAMKYEIAVAPQPIVSE
jgi:diguanylate cyclase (GGDEF)-like protein